MSWFFYFRLFHFRKFFFLVWDRTQNLSQSKQLRSISWSRGLPTFFLSLFLSLLPGHMEGQKWSQTRRDCQGSRGQTRETDRVSLYGPGGSCAEINSVPLCGPSGSFSDDHARKKAICIPLAPLSSLCRQRKIERGREREEREKEGREMVVGLLC